jgi:hypothetical protein
LYRTAAVEHQTFLLGEMKVERLSQEGRREQAQQAPFPTRRAWGRTLFLKFGEQLSIQISVDRFQPS